MSFKYSLAICGINKVLVNEYVYSIRVFLNDTEAIIKFKKQVRDELLKKHKNVNCIITKEETSNGIKQHVEIHKFSEDRLGEHQRTLRFLVR